MKFSKAKLEKACFLETAKMSKDESFNKNTKLPGKAKSLNFCKQFLVSYGPVLNEREIQIGAYLLAYRVLGIPRGG